jgi:hypothetical protein
VSVVVSVGCVWLVHCAKEKKGKKDKADKKDATEKDARKRPCEGEASSSKEHEDHLLPFAAPTPRKAPFSRQPLAALSVDAPCGIVIAVAGRSGNLHGAHLFVESPRRKHLVCVSTCFGRFPN